jgi:hypothetical protein
MFVLPSTWWFEKVILVDRGIPALRVDTTVPETTAYRYQLLSPVAYQQSEWLRDFCSRHEDRFPQALLH